VAQARRGDTERDPSPHSLDAQDAKRGNLEGAVAFAALAAPDHRLSSARAMVAYQAAFDYLDCLCETPHADPIRNGAQLNHALLLAVQPGQEHDDYYAHHAASEDGGYLRALVAACRSALGVLPAYPAVSDGLVRLSSRVAAYQTVNHGDADGSHDAFARWATSEAAHYGRRGEAPKLCWWEIGAAGGSSLAVFALIAAATDPLTGHAQAAAIEDAYFPWIGAVNSLLDSLIDQNEDDAPGQHRLLDYYASPEQAADRLELISTHAIHRARELGPRHGHTLILAAMTSLYLSSADARAPNLCCVRKRLRRCVGPLDTPTMLVMHARRTAGLIAAHGREQTNAGRARISRYLNLK